ncbi:type IV secretion system DNA-binding domain-containing protein [Candidatus Gracilibacteria bacterium]|nr:type IV secretion system DNA-binding domain-containing protein [Candidatus Gracilibacteria bacterium]
MPYTFFEILVDRSNENGAIVFNEILSVLHRAFSYKDQSTSFSFEIVKVGNRIRFFLRTPQKYAQFLTGQIYAHFHNIEILEVGDYLKNIPESKLTVGKLELTKHHYYSLKTFETDLEIGSKVQVDPYSAITSALSKTGKYTLTSFSVHFRPLPNYKWKKRSEYISKVLQSSLPKSLQKLLLHPSYSFLKILFYPFIFFGKILSFLIVGGESQKEEVLSSGEETQNPFFNKLSREAYEVDITLLAASESDIESHSSIKEIASTLSVYTLFGQNALKLKYVSQSLPKIQAAKNRTLQVKNILSTTELAGLVHLPTSYVTTPYINWVTSRAFEPPSNLPVIDPDLSDDIHPKTPLTPIGKTNFRGTDISFGISPDDRRRHMYIIGKTGMGKSVLLENMILDDINKGRGVAVIDPHGDLVESIIGNIPKKRTNQTIIFDPSDKEWPIAFNMLEDVGVSQRAFVASGLVGIFKRIFGDSWGPRLEHTLRNTILALMEYPGTTLISIPLMLTSEVYRSKVVAKITDPVVKKFWTHEFGKLSPQQRTETAGPILNKVGQFLSSTILRNVLGQPKNSFSLRWAMDKKKIIVVNLSKGKIGEDASSLLGAMLVTKFQLDAMSRADIPESERQDFYLYVDEFQNFATDSFATILSEARKYKLNLVMANQYIDQMTEEVRGAVFGNVGTLVSFQVGSSDAKLLTEAFTGGIEADDLMNQKKYTIYLKQLIDGMPSPIFSASTFPPHPHNNEEFSERYKNILQVSRERYTKPRQLVEEKIQKLISDLELDEKRWEEIKSQKKSGTDSSPVKGTLGIKKTTKKSLESKKKK